MQLFNIFTIVIKTMKALNKIKAFRFKITYYQRMTSKTAVDSVVIHKNRSSSFMTCMRTSNE